MVGGGRGRKKGLEGSKRVIEYFVEEIVCFCGKNGWVLVVK